MAEEGADIDTLMEEVGELKTVWRVVILYFRCQDWWSGACSRCHGLWYDTDVTALSGGQRTKVLLELLLEKPDILLRETNQLLGCWTHWRNKRYLQNYENAFVLISSRYSFLEWCPQYQLSCWKSTLIRYSGIHQFPRSLCCEEIPS